MMLKWKLIVALISGLTFISYAQWEELTNFDQNNSIKKIVVTKEVNSTVGVILPGLDSAFISNDNGTNWDILNPGESFSGITDMVINEGAIGLSSNDKIYVTNNNGQDFDEAFTPTYVVLEFSMNGENYLSKSTYYSLDISFNNGAEWSTVDRYDIEDYDWDCWQGGGPHCATVQTFGDFKLRTGNNLYYNLQRYIYEEGIGHLMSDYGLHKSWDNGLSWIRLDLLDVNLVDYSYPKLYAATPSGLFSLSDGEEEWFQLSNEVFLAFAVDGINIIGLTEENIWVSNDRGDSWISFPKGIDYTIDSKFAINEEYIFASIDEKLYRTAIGYFPLSSEELNEETIKLSPNPSKGIITIESNQSTEILIYNIAGQLVLTTKIEMGSTQIDLSKYDSGIYFLQGVLNEKMLNEKIILQK